MALKAPKLNRDSIRALVTMGAILLLAGLVLLSPLGYPAVPMIIIGATCLLIAWNIHRSTPVPTPADD